MNILIAFGNQLVSHALKEVLEKSNGKCHVQSLCTARNNSPDMWNDHEVIITDYLTLAKVPKDCFEHSKVLIMDNGLERETVVSLFLTENIVGLIPANADVDVLLKAINVVRNGEVWIDNSTVKSLLNRSITKKVKETAKLTERETAIIRLVREGYRNKEIAHLLSISEQTVKSHLNRIFRKMNVSARTELIAQLASKM